MARTVLQEDQASETSARLVKNADFVLLHFSDILGYLKGRTIPATQVNKALTDGVPFDGSSIAGGVSIEESDMIMKPDANTFTVFPYYFYEKGVAGFICDIQTPDGKQFENNPRNVCRKTIEKLSTEGYVPTAAAELEFYLVQRNGQGEVLPVENHIVDRQRYFDIAPGRDVTETYRMDLSTALQAMGITVEREHHEVGSAQNEITFKYSNPLKTSDNIMRFKFSAKAIAEKKYGWTATFMPKPWQGKAGTGMHIHVGLTDRKTNKNLFYDQNGYACISQECRYFIGGLLEHARAICAVAAPSVNSYKRLVPGYEAPVYIAWSKKNRSALIRIPAFKPNDGEDARIEFRCPDALSNPYFVYAVAFEAGLDGIKKKIDPGDPLDVNLYHISDADRKKLGVKIMPASLKEALDEWNNDYTGLKALGKQTAESYADLKLQEWKEYEPHATADRTTVTAWELQKYLYC